jgi:hypothetical protein
MYADTVPGRAMRLAVSIGVLVLGVGRVGAQSASGASSPQHDMAHMHMGQGEPSAMDREGSGTSWLPDETPMYAIHSEAGGWSLMGHGSVFLQYLHETGDRGGHQVGSVNWFMGMADRNAAGGRLRLRGMVSLEPWTIRGCGYPDLLASGELCNGQAIHDRQHPHDLFMELAATYDRPLTRQVSLQIYGGPVGEPALGPVAFMHRLSAMPNPMAPITHHWFDSTHITYGVVTGAVYGQQWKAEGSVFNGREPDEHRTNFDFGAMDSWSGRLWYLPTKRWAFQVSAGHLKEAEVRQPDEPRIDVDRATVSATYHRALERGGIWANTLGWGRNAESVGERTNAFMAESSLSLEDRDAVYARFETSQKSSHDLALPGDQVFTVAKIQGGYTRYLTTRAGLKPGIGAAVSESIVPADLRPFYGSRLNAGFAVYVTLRPAVMMHMDQEHSPTEQEEEQFLNGGTPPPSPTQHKGEH